MGMFDSLVGKAKSAAGATGEAANTLGNWIDNPVKAFQNRGPTNIAGKVKDAAAYLNGQPTPSATATVLSVSKAASSPPL